MGCAFVFSYASGNNKRREFRIETASGRRTVHGNVGVTGGFTYKSVYNS